MANLGDALAGTPRWLYEVVYCARGQAENLVKAHKVHLASDRTSCTKATANQFRLVLLVMAVALTSPGVLTRSHRRRRPWRGGCDRNRWRHRCAVWL